MLNQSVDGISSDHDARASNPESVEPQTYKVQKFSFGYEISTPTKEEAVAIIRKFVSECFPRFAEKVQPGGMLDPDRHPLIQPEGHEGIVNEKPIGSGRYVAKIGGNGRWISSLVAVWLMKEGYRTQPEPEDKIWEKTGGM